MYIEGNKAVLLRIFIAQEDKHKGHPVYELIVKKARELGLAGATVLKGVMGFGAQSRLSMSNFLRISEDLPLVIELIDDEEYINEILPYVKEVMVDGLITMEKVDIIRYGRLKRDERKK